MGVLRKAQVIGPESVHRTPSLQAFICSGGQAADSAYGVLSDHGRENLSVARK